MFTLIGRNEPEAIDLGDAHLPILSPIGGRYLLTSIVSGKALRRLSQTDNPPNRMRLGGTSNSRSGEA